MLISAIEKQLNWKRDTGVNSFQTTEAEFVSDHHSRVEPKN